MKGRRLLVWGFCEAILQLVYIFMNISKMYNETVDEWEVIGLNIVTQVIAPFLILYILGVIFNIIAAVQHNKWFALVAAILYVLSVAMKISEWPVAVIPGSFCFIAFVKMSSD